MGVTFTPATPLCVIPIFSAALLERSRLRPWTKGPRSLMRTFTERPVSGLVITAVEPIGKLVDAAVRALGLYASPLAVARPAVVLP
jgi:hypothetical protein